MRKVSKMRISDRQGLLYRQNNAYKYVPTDADAPVYIPPVVSKNEMLSV